MPVYRGSCYPGPCNWSHPSRRSRTAAHPDAVPIIARIPRSRREIAPLLADERGLGAIRFRSPTELSHDFERPFRRYSPDKAYQGKTCFACRKYTRSVYFIIWSKRTARRKLPLKCEKMAKEKRDEL
jgi:hypothetical protein